MHSILELLPFLADGENIPCFGASFDDLIEAQGYYVVEDEDVLLKVEMIDFWGNTQDHEAVYEEGQLVSDVRPHGYNFVAVIMVTFGDIRVAFKGYEDENPFGPIYWEPIGLHALTAAREADWRGAYPPCDRAEDGAPMPSKFVTYGFLGNCLWEQVAYDESRDATFYGNGMWFPTEPWEIHYSRKSSWTKPSPPKGGWKSIKNIRARRRHMQSFNDMSNLFHQYCGEYDEIAEDWAFNKLLGADESDDQLAPLFANAPRWFRAKMDKLAFYKRQYVSLEEAIEIMKNLGGEEDEDQNNHVEADCG